MLRLNGWQRIGVLLSVLWVVAIASLASYTYYEGSSVENCREYHLKTTPQAETDLTLLDFLCGKPGSKKSGPDILTVLALLVLPIAGAWFLLYGIVWTAKWIVAGFKPKNDI
jgi:hypothetical protein